MIPSSGFCFGPNPGCSVTFMPTVGHSGAATRNLSLSVTALKGFDSKYPNDWNLGAYSGGCTRRNSLQCENPELVKRKDQFFANHYMKLPDNNKIVASSSQKECESTCMSNCTCNAYTYDNNQCTIWYGDIMNLRQLTEGDSDAKTLYLKLAASEFPSNKTNEGILIGAVVGSVVVVILVGLFLFVILRRKRAIKHGKTVEGSMMKSEVLVGNAPLLHDTEKRIKDLIDSGDFDEKDEKSIDVPSFDFDCLVAATDDFSDANKLGQGGFRSVYKGRFAGGQEIAIKRLSSVSGQGLEEFKNEVLLIAKLQHRNLVRLLGYCFKGDEKILIYEYYPNKSLDFSLFYGNLNAFMNWEVRFNIILGITRGLLYLHQDSRLRIVHRDLKTSNILLDKELNPKISDFGLAKIVEGKRNEGCTNRVVGTYGYMSPEYALDGLFSVKSDVFSFGVVVLEILSGKRNTAYFKSEDVPSLLGYAWKLWREEKPLGLMDDNLSHSCNAREFLKCMNIALLCVQDEPTDRPTMSDVVVMLSSETETFPTPKQPAFFAKQGFSTSTVKKVLLFSSERGDTDLTAHSRTGK